MNPIAADMILVLTFCSIGVFTSIYLGFQFSLKGKKHSESNIYLGVFFFLLGLRLGKLLVQQLAPQPILDAYFNIMHASYLGLGPIVWIYIRSFLNSGKKSYRSLIHFLPSFILLIGAFQIRQAVGESIWIPFYWIVQLHPLGYMIASAKLIRQRHTTKDQMVWLYSLPGTVLFIAITNLLYFSLNFPFYLVTSLLLIMTTYLIIAMAFSGKLGPIINKQKEKYKNLQVPAAMIEDTWISLQNLLEKESLYLDQNLKLSHLSAHLDMPTHVVSMVINTRTGDNFTNYINGLRIDNAKKKIAEDGNKKILAIALESGFSSLSAFNRAFKKHTGIIPSEYRYKFRQKDT